MSTDEAKRLLRSMERYAAARAESLRDVGIAGSNRDQLAEFSEHLAAALLDGKLATSRVQKSYDLVDQDGRHVQVRYLANAADHWLNEHLVTFSDDLDAYALVVFENLLPTGMVVFPRDGMSAIGSALRKRHPNQHHTLQLTRANWQALVARPAEFGNLGVRFYLPPTWGTEEAK